MTEPPEAPTRPGNPLDREAMTLFAEVMDQPESARKAWLAARCADRPGLLERIEQLIEADACSTGFLESTPVRGRPVNRVGERLGAYELVSELASGGMSRVYRGRRVDVAYQHDVAINLFAAFHMDPSVLRRFDTERQILAALEHPGIARIIDGGTAADGTPYLIMELVEGEPITRYCERNRIDLAGRLQLFIKVCEALAFAHRRGIVHRDIKPANVLVSQAGDPKLIDFGIAKVLQPERMALELPETRIDQRPLTPEYASPEQLSGQAVAVPSDIYSLGVLLYELLTGLRPHQIGALSAAEAERVVLGTIPADPSQAVARGRQPPPSGLGEQPRLRRQLRGDLDRIVMTAMRREPEARFASVMAFAEDIERHLAGQAVRARGASRLYRIGKFIGRHRTGVSAIAVAFLALATALITVQIQSREAQRQRDQAESAKQFLVEMIRRVDPYENTESATLLGAIKQAIPDIGARFAGQPALEAEMRYAMGYALQNLGEIDLARVQLARAHDLRMVHGSALQRAEAEEALGIIAWWDSDFDRASAHFGRALEWISDGRSQAAINQRVTTLVNWSGLLIDGGDYERARAVGERALSLTPDATVPAGTLASLWTNLATARESVGDDAGALAAFDEALIVQRADTGSRHPAYAIILNNRGLLQYRLGQHDDALDALGESVQIRLETLGDAHPQTATAMINLARMLTLSGRPEEARPHAERGLEIAFSGWEPGHPRIGKAHEALALIHHETGRPDLAREQAEQALALYRAAPGVDPNWVSTIEALLSELDGNDPSGGDLR